MRRIRELRSNVDWNYSDRFAERDVHYREIRSRPDTFAPRATDLPLGSDKRLLRTAIKMQLAKQDGGEDRGAFLRAHS